MDKFVTRPGFPLLALCRCAAIDDVGLANQEKKLLRETRSKGPLQVLLVEDEPVQARLVKELLTRGSEEGRPCQVTVCANLSAALSHQEPVDAVILDIGLPDADPEQVVPRIVSRFAGKAVVVLTGRDARTHGEKAITQGAQDFLSKDEIDGPALYRALRYAMVRVRLASALDKTGKDTAGSNRPEPRKS